MTDSPPAVSVARLEAAAAPLLASGATTRSFELDGCLYVFKRDCAKTWPRARSWLAALACLLAFGEWAAPGALRTGGIRQEAARLRELARAGRRVPAVLLQHDGYLVLSHVGASLDILVDRQTPAQNLALFERVADDLADWHRRGYWHGGAQLRNVTQQSDDIYRIDFEERYGYALSPSATRAYDVFLFFSDAWTYLEPEQLQEQGLALLRRYIEQTRDPALPALLRGLRRLMLPVLWVDRLWPRLMRKRDKQRVVRFAKVIGGL
jgi:tRNA A-37 threonylcarbamoyl transferase component Bud32